MIVQPTPNRTLVHNFTGIPKGSHYTVTVAINTDKAQPAVAEVSADPLPAPTQLRVWPEKNGSYSVHWKEIDFHDEKHKYETVVFEGMGINGTQVALIEAKEAPVQIHQSHLGGAAAAGKVFTVGVRMKTERVSKFGFNRFYRENGRSQTKSIINRASCPTLTTSNISPYNQMASYPTPTKHRARHGGGTSYLVL